MEKYRFITVCFGDDFVNLFLNVTLPSLLAKGNLPHFVEHYPSKLHILTNNDGMRKLHAHPSLQLARKYLDIEFEQIDTSLKPHKYIALTRWQNIAIRKALNEGESLGFLIPDGIWSSNCFVHIVNALKSGKAMVAWAPLRLSVEKFLPELDGGYRTQNGALEIGGRTLASLGMRNLHSHSVAAIWGQDKSVNHSGQLLWPYQEGQMGLRSYYVTPIVISKRGDLCEVPEINHPETLKRGIFSTFGDMYPMMPISKREQVWLPTDSDDFMHFEISEDMKVGGKKKTIRDFVLWSEQQAADCHVELFDTLFKFHSVDWSVDLHHEDLTLEIVRAVKKSRKRPAWYLAKMDKEALKRRATYYNWREEFLPAKGRKRGVVESYILKKVVRRLFS